MSVSDSDFVTLIAEFADFTVPSTRFTGGCVKSEEVENVCVHINSHGHALKAEENCRSYDSCTNGYRYNYRLY
jgi:hypothetical protein